ncbi:MFS transporter [Streptomyces sp. NPDC087917]|uniref:MFS transporter n=1 Tax=Streptomyces sp. NPDC087917 TaxID=3155060 RepID=UPI00341AB724
MKHLGSSPGTTGAGAGAGACDLPGATGHRWALAALSLGMLLSSLGTSIANVALPALADAFDATFPQVQWIVLAYLLALTTLIVGVGRLGDTIGRRRLLLAGTALFTAASAVCGLAPTLGLLIAARAAQGLGAAVMMTLTMAFVGETVPKAATGRAMGLLGTTSAIGTALGPSLGGVLMSGPGWRAVFLVGVPLGLLALLLAHRHLPADSDLPTGSHLPTDRRRTRTDRPPFDRSGTLLLALTLASYALAMTTWRGGSGPLSLGLLLAAALGTALFVRVERGAAYPLIGGATLREPALRSGLVMSVLVSTVMMATLVVGPFHLSRALGLGQVLTGLVLSAGPVVAALAGVPAGRLTDRHGAHRTTTAGLTAMTAGCLGLSLMPTRYGALGYVVPLVVVTAGYAVFQTANNTAVMAGADPDRRGVTSGLLNLSRNLGLITGASVMGAVFLLASETPDITTAAPEAVAAGTRTTFAVAAALTAAALAVAATARRRTRPTGEFG